MTDRLQRYSINADMQECAFRDDLFPEYMTAEEVACYLRCTIPKVATYRKKGLLKYAKYGKFFVYKRSWVDQFAEEWQGYDLSNDEMIQLAIDSKAWKDKHERKHKT